MSQTIEAEEQAQIFHEMYAEITKDTEEAYALVESIKTHLPDEDTVSIVTFRMVRDQGIDILYDWDTEDSASPTKLASMLFAIGKGRFLGTHIEHFSELSKGDPKAKAVLVTLLELLELQGDINEQIENEPMVDALHVFRDESDDSKKKGDQDDD